MEGDVECRPVPDPPSTHSRPMSLFGFKIVMGTRGRSWILGLERWLSRLVPNTHFRWLPTTCTFRSRGAGALYWPPHRHGTQTHIHTIKKIKSF